MYRLMIVDDEVHILSALKRSLKRDTDWEIEVFSSGAEALKRAHETDFDLFISDYRMPEMNGVEFLIQAKAIQPEAIRLILSGYSDLDSLLRGINEAEIYRFINKPWQDYDLRATIKQALQHRAVIIENQRLADQVRAQLQQLDEQSKILAELEAETPGITHVDWTEDGAILLNEDDV
ncbi:MAG: response regulator [Candidatus Polarisedimenticolaceae bacterium]|nr:response regulator [Candidatus Polarisedimenticolaceae bacterium]